VSRGDRTSFLAAILSLYQLASGKNIWCHSDISFTASKRLRNIALVCVRHGTLLQSCYIVDNSLKLINFKFTTVNKILYLHVKINVIHHYQKPMLRLHHSSSRVQHLPMYLLSEDVCSQIFHTQPITGHQERVQNSVL
jgi:hypothetical protein